MKFRGSPGIDRGNTVARHRCEKSAHKKTWNAPVMFLTKKILAHISYTSFQIQMSSGKMLHKRNL